MVDEQHPRPAGEHDIPTITLGLDGARTGAALVYTRPVDGGEWTEIGYITDGGSQYPPDVPAELPNGYDKSPEATRYRTERIVEWHTPPSNIDLAQIQAEIAAVEERRIRDYRLRTGLSCEHRHHPERVDWLPVVAEWEARYRRASYVHWDMPYLRQGPAITGAVAGYRGPDGLDRWEDDGGG